MTKIGQGALDSIVSPGGIRSNQLKDRSRHFARRWRSSRILLSTVTVIPLLGNQSLVPAQQRVRGDDGGDLFQQLASEDLALDREVSSLRRMRFSPISSLSTW